MDKTTTLKPCPFCGGAASMNHRHGAKVSFRATCMKCLGLAGQTHDTEGEAIAAWNHRPTEQALTEQAIADAAAFMELAKQNQALLEELTALGKDIRHLLGNGDIWNVRDLSHIVASRTLHGRVDAIIAKAQAS